MNDFAIRVENLGKQYRIAGKRERYRCLRDTLTDALAAPLRRAAKLLRGQATGAAELDETIWALKGISFQVNQGEVVGVIGRNGAGKSTLLKLLSRITEPTEGCVELSGRVSTLLEVGTGFHPELTGRENIYLNGAILGMKQADIERKFDEIVAFAEVEKFVDTPVKHYSTGMSVRLGFAVAAHTEPDILLVDEVLAVGDAGFQRKCLGAMNDLGRSGRTVILVSHNMAAIEKLCSRTVWIHDGQIRQDGKSEDIIRAYLSNCLEKQETDFSLRHKKDRGGSGEVRYTEIEFLTTEGEPQKLIRSGDSLVMRLHYHADKIVRYPYFGVQIYTQLGILVTSLTTWTSGFEIPSLPLGPGHIDLQIESLNLAPSHYLVSLWLASTGPKWYDRLDHCARFEVEMSDFFKTGRRIPGQFGIILMQCKWQCNRSQHQSYGMPRESETTPGSRTT